MKISIIVAIATNHVIGVDNQLPWHLPADLQYFKALTLNHPIIMGRKTYESIGRPLPKRENIVISRSQNIHNDQIVLKNSIEQAFEYCRSKSYNEVFIIGGDTIYKQTISLADKLYITRVNTTIENGNAFFPEIDLQEWKLISSMKNLADEKNQFNYSFDVYEKATKLS